MSSHFSANQYEGAFTSKALANWENPQTYKSRPFTLKGHTKIIADNRGHLKDCTPRSEKNPWGDFIGTWEMPEKIAGNRSRVPTGRTSLAQQKLREESKAAQGVLSGTAKNQHRQARMRNKTPPPRPDRVEAHTPVDQPMGGYLRSPSPPEHSLPPTPVKTPVYEQQKAYPKSPMDVGNVMTPPLLAASPVMPMTPASFHCEMAPMSPQRIVSP